jgi:hypothetical protein
MAKLQNSNLSKMSNQDVVIDVLVEDKRKRDKKLTFLRKKNVSFIKNSFSSCMN